MTRPAFLLLAAPWATSSAPATRTRALPRLKVSGDHRFLVTTGGKPFFYLVTSKNSDRRHLPAQDTAA